MPDIELIPAEFSPEIPKWFARCQAGISRPCDEAMLDAYGVNPRDLNAIEGEYEIKHVCTCGCHSGTQCCPDCGPSLIDYKG